MSKLEIPQNYDVSDDFCCFFPQSWYDGVEEGCGSGSGACWADGTGMGEDRISPSDIWLSGYGPGFGDGSGQGSENGSGSSKYIWDMDTEELSGKGFSGGCAMLGSWDFEYTSKKCPECDSLAVHYISHRRQKFKSFGGKSNQPPSEGGSY